MVCLAIALVPADLEACKRPDFAAGSGANARFHEVLLRERSNPPGAVDLLLDAFEESKRHGEARLAAIHGSTSWKITAPLRALVEILRTGLKWVALRMPGRASRPTPDVEPATGANVKDWYDERTPDVSVIVLNFNKGAMTVECLEALWSHTTDFRYEIIVVDNGSVAREAGILEAFPGRFRLVKLPVNRQFGEGNNIGAEMAKGHFLVFLNNDAFVTPGWLGPMMAALVKDPSVGVVGPRLIFPDGRLQEAGSLITPDGVTWQRGLNGSLEDPTYQRPCRVHYCSAACVLMRRDVFFQVLGFDHWWEPAYYEDSDLCLKIARLGLETWYCPDTTVVHVGNATTNDPRLGFRMATALDINRGKFLRRWRGYLRLQDEGSIAHPAPSITADPPAARKRIGLYLPPPWGFGEPARYLLRLAEVLSTDQDVGMIVDTAYSRSRLLALGRDLGLALAAVGITVDDGRASDELDVLVTLGDDVLAPRSGRAKRHAHIFWPSARPLTAVGVPSDAEGSCRYDLLVVESERDQERAATRYREIGLEPRTSRVIGRAIAHGAALERAMGQQNRQILHIGRFADRDRRPQRMLDAFRNLCARDGAARLALAGIVDADWDARASFIRMRDAARDLPVTMISDPTQREETDLIAGSLVYWLIADNGDEEPVATALLEAMAAGVIPIVLDPRGTMPIVDHGRTGLRVTSIEELVHVTRQVLSESESSRVRALSSAAVGVTRAFSTAAFTATWRDALFPMEAG